MATRSRSSRARAGSSSVPVAADAPRVSRCRLSEKFSDEQVWLKRGTADPPLLGSFFGGWSDENAFLATDIGAQQGAWRRKEDMQESNESLAKSPKSSIK